MDKCWVVVCDTFGRCVLYMSTISCAVLRGDHVSVAVGLAARPSIAQHSTAGNCSSLMDDGIHDHRSASNCLCGLVCEEDAITHEWTAVLCCAMLCCAVLCCAVPCRFCGVVYVVNAIIHEWIYMPCCAVPGWAVLWRAVLCCALLCCTVPCFAVLCRALPCFAVLCSALPCCAVMCSALLCDIYSCHMLHLICLDERFVPACRISRQTCCHS